MRGFLFNNPTLKERRQKLRTGATNAEKILWKALQKSQLGLKFRRQYSVGNYILDFYCPEKRLGIEIDGGIHVKRKELDEYRTRTIEKLGVRIIRFWNKEIENCLEKVTAKIHELAEE